MSWEMNADLVALMLFASGVLLLDFFDISLPRGDSVGVAGAMVSAGIVALDPLLALAIGVASSLVVLCSRALARGGDTRVDEVLIRLFSGLAAAGASLLAAASQGTVEAVSMVGVPAVFLTTELAARQVALALRSDRALLGLLYGNAMRQGLLMAAEVSSAALAVMLYESMHVWSLIPVFTLLMLIRQSYAMLLEVRETYHTTLYVLVDAAESPEPGRRGHSERVASITRAVASKCRLRPTEVERLSYAALLHDVHGIADSPPSHTSGIQSSSAVVRDVGFLQEVLPILRVLDGHEGREAAERDLLGAFIVALASDVDAATKPEVAAAHDRSSLGALAGFVPPRIKARVLSAAVSLGYPIPAIR